MKKLTLLVLFLVPSLVLAGCYEEITKDGNLSSQTYRLESDEMEEYAVFDETTVIDVVDLVIRRETSCNFKDVAIEGSSPTCYAFPHSGVTCEVPTSIGYFIVHRSAYGVFDHSIIYTRWD